MTSKKLAELLNGIEYEKLVRQNGEIAEIFKDAKYSNLVVVYGASDDLIEFSGAINDEAGVYNGGIVYIDDESVVYDYETENSIEAIWGCEDATWKYKTEIEHCEFEIMEDGQVLCRGIVFSLEDLM